MNVNKYASVTVPYAADFFFRFLVRSSLIMSHSKVKKVTLELAFGL